MMGEPKDNRSYFSSSISRGTHNNEPFQQERQVIVHILQQVQVDYSHARKQLEHVHHAFGERQRAAGEQLRYLLDTVTRVPTRIDDKNTENKGEYGASESLVSPQMVFLRAYCFGNFEVYLNGKRLDTWSSLKAKSLLKFLISRRGKPVARDVLVETLWPNCKPEVGCNNLKSAVCALRQVLRRGELNDDNKSRCPFVQFSEARYMLSSKLEFWVDVDDFERMWTVGQRLEKQRNIEGAAKQYQLADELYRGDYLEDELYAEWTLLRREALKDTYLAILGKLANISFKANNYENCIRYSQKILSKDSCHEEAYRWLIRCYIRLGQRHRAQQWYALCVATLKRELDSIPDHETISLYHQLLHQDPIQ
jgi:two-component SAPR family response regulator